MNTTTQLSGVAVSSEVEVLANRIRENSAKIGHADRETLKTAVCIGQDLGKIKDSFAQDGKKCWQKWVEKTCEMTARTIRNYIRVAKASEAGLLHDCTSLMDAYTVLRKTAPKKAAKQVHSAVVTAGTIDGLKSLAADETVVRVQASKEMELRHGFKEAWSKYHKTIKQYGRMIVVLEKTEGSTKKSKVGTRTAKATVAKAKQTETSTPAPVLVAA